MMLTQKSITEKNPAGVLVAIILPQIHGDADFGPCLVKLAS